MQEIAIILSSLAGVATAAAVRNIPKNKLQNIRANTHIRNQITSLKIEEELLTKTISRLYQTDGNLPNIQRDKLLQKYQHQLGAVISKLEKLEDVSHHSDFGPVGDGLITLMDQKLSKLDDRLYELSSRIGTINQSVPKTKDTEDKSEINKSNKAYDIKKQELEPKEQSNHKQSFEPHTLNKSPNNESESSLLKKPTVAKKEIIQETVQPKIESKKEIIQETVQTKIESKQKPDLNKEIAKINKFKALPEPQKSNIFLEDEFDDNTDDIDQIKGEIMKVLSKIEQAEVE